MSFAYDSDLEPTDEELAAELGDEYGGFFNEEDFLSLGIDPAQPTDAKPGSEEKVVTLAARYAAGLPLWHTDDRYDHGPGQVGVAEMPQGEVFLLEEED
jgi:hypothetical protein